MKHWLKTMENTEIGDGLYECIDCAEAFDYWPSDTEPRSECPGEPTPVTEAIRNATTHLPDSVKKRMALALGWVDPEPNNPFHNSLCGDRGYVRVWDEDIPGDGLTSQRPCPDCEGSQ